MKIAITKEAKRILTVAEMPAVRRLIKDLREDDDLEYYANLAAIVAAGSYDADVLKVSAEIAKNCRVRNAYHDESADLDVWVRFTAYTDAGFVMGGAYLTDIWQITSDNNEEIRRNMYIRLFREVKEQYLEKWIRNCSHQKRRFDPSPEIMRAERTRHGKHHIHWQGRTNRGRSP